LIIVDDCSTDNTEAIASAFNDERIIYIRHSENRGRSAARNTGIKNSKGDFITLLDSGDEYLPEKIEKSIRAFRNSSDRIGMVASNYYITDKKNKNIGIVKTDKKRRLYLHISSWVLHRRVFEKVGLFDERLLLSQDVDFFSRFRKRFSFHLIDEPLLIIHRSEDGAFSDMGKVIKTRKKYLLNLQGGWRLYARHMNYLGKDFCYIGQKKEARRYFLKAFIVYPFNIGYFIKFLKTF
jgi:glycosyltransferase involved in cell wall biosynthesis